MKAIKIVFLFAMFFMGTQAFAQKTINLVDASDKELSDYFKQQADELNAEIKLVKTKLKGDKLNGELKGQLVQLQNNVKRVKENKKIVDNAIKAQAKADKDIAKAEKMQKQAEQAKQKAMESKKKAEEAARRALTIRQ